MNTKKPNKKKRNEYIREHFVFQVDTMFDYLRQPPPVYWRYDIVGGVQREGLGG